MSARIKFAWMPLVAACLLPLAAQAQTEPGPAIVKSTNIIDALSAKDVVLDGQRPHGNAPAHDPSVSLQVQFGFNSATLTPWGQRQLDELAAALNSAKLRNASFEVAGHTDRVGTAEFNQNLSLNRADAVKAYLIQIHGVAGNRLLTRGYGFTRLADARDPAAPVNRRVEVRRIGLAPGAAMPLAPQGHGSIVPSPK